MLVRLHPLKRKMDIFYLPEAMDMQELISMIFQHSREVLNILLSTGLKIRLMMEKITTILNWKLVQPLYMPTL